MRTRINEINSELIETVNIWYCNGVLDMVLKEQFDYTTLAYLKEFVSYLIEDYRQELENMWLKRFKGHHMEQQAVDALILMEHILMVNLIARQVHQKLISERVIFENIKN